MYHLSYLPSKLLHILVFFSYSSCSEYRTDFFEVGAQKDDIIVWHGDRSLHKTGCEKEEERTGRKPRRRQIEDEEWNRGRKRESEKERWA